MYALIMHRGRYLGGRRAEAVRLKATTRLARKCEVRRECFVASCAQLRCLSCVNSLIVYTLPDGIRTEEDERGGG